VPDAYAAVYVGPRHIVFDASDEAPARLVELAIRWLEELAAKAAETELVYMEDLGIERVRIGPDF
jgi:hypothetical protein